MCIFSFFKRNKKKPQHDDELALKGAEVVHDAGLTDQESAGSKQSQSIQQDILKEKKKDPNKSVR
jgi:hypothetical protein